MVRTWWCKNAIRTIQAQPTTGAQQIHVGYEGSQFGVDGRLCDSVSGPACTSGSAPAGGGVSSGNPSNGIHVGWSRASASHRHPKTVFTTELTKMPSTRRCYRR